MSKEAPKKSKNDFPDDELDILDEKFPDLPMKEETNEKVDKDAAAMHRRVRISRKGIFAQRKQEAEAADEQQNSVPEQEAPSSLQALQKVIKENPVHQGTFSALYMIAELLKNSYKPGAVEISTMGFDQKNLHELMRAIFSVQRGSVVGSVEINGAFSQWERKSVSIIYDYLLGLDEDADEETIRKEYALLVTSIGRLKDLLSYRPVRFVPAALAECNEKDDIEYEEDEEPETNEAIIKRFGFDGAPIRFDEAEIKKMLQEAAEAKDAQADARQFLVEHLEEPALRTLKTLQQVFAVSPAEYQTSHQQKFNGEALAQIVAKLDARFPEIPGLGRELRMAGEQGENVTAALQRIIESHDIKDPAILKDTLAEMHRTIGRLYPDLLDAGDPVRAEMDDELMTFYKEFWKNPDTKTHFFPLYHLYYALGWDEDRYNAEYRAKYFGNQSRQQVMENIDSQLRPGVSARIQQASRTGDNYRTALIRFVALAQGHTEYGDALKTDIIKVSQVLGNLYPAIRAK